MQANLKQEKYTEDMLQIDLLINNKACKGTSFAIEGEGDL